jgi:hypothetical protein
MAVVFFVSLCSTAEPAPPARPLSVFLIATDEPVAEDLTPAGQAAVREGQSLRAQFLQRLRKAEGVVLVTDETAADARLEIREAVVHHVYETERSERKPPVKTPGVKGGAIGEQVTDLGIARTAKRDYALTVRLTIGSTFADFTNSTKDTSAGSAADTVVGRLRRWVREHDRARAGRPP